MDIVITKAELLKAANVRLGDADGDGLIGHLHQREGPLRDVAGQCEASLAGGHGKTGGFQAGLHRFSVKFGDLLERFNTQHHDFIVFLEGLRDRMRAAAGDYHTAEQQNVGRLSSIARTLDSE